MHTPSPESEAELMTWVKGGCDLGHRGLNPCHHLVVERTQLVFVAFAIKCRWRLTQQQAADRWCSADLSDYCSGLPMVFRSLTTEQRP